MFERLSSLQQTRLGVMLGAVLLAGLGFLFTTSFALAAAPTMTAATDDTNNDGTVDQIVITLSEASSVDDAGAGFASIALSSGCSIPAGLNVNSASTTTITLAGLTGCTAGDTSITPTITYTAQANCATDTSICDAADANQMVTGAPNATSTDGADPVLSAVVVSKTALSGLTYNTIAFTYTEAMQISNGGAFQASGTLASTANLGDMRVTQVLEGLATWDGASDMTNAAATDNTVGVSTSTITAYINAQTTGYFNAGSTAPSTDTYTPISIGTYVKDLSGNAVNALSTPVVATVGTAWDVTKPTVSDVYSCDSDADGDVDRFQMIFDEAVLDAYLSANVASFEGDTNTTNAGDATEETATTFSTETLGCDGAVTDATANDAKIRLGLTTGLTGTGTAYVNFGAAAIRDVEGNRAVAADNSGTEDDNAGPVLMTVSPTDGAAGVSTSSTIVWTFSEPMNTTAGQLTYTQTGGSNTFTEAWTNSGTYGNNAIVTLTPVGLLPGGYHSLTITAAPASAGTVTAFAGMATAAVTSPYNFQVRSSTDTSTSGASTVGGDTTYEIVVTSPETSDSLAVGDTHDITWTSSESSMMSVVSINFNYTNEDGDSVQETIVSNTVNDGSYSWTVPNVVTSNASIHITGSDLVDTLATADSGTFSIVAVAVDDTVTAPDSGETGLSPVTGEEESISVVAYGDYVKSPSYSTVYYIDRNDAGTLIRRPFIDAQTFLTWQDDFSDVVTITDATLPTMSLGGPMLPKAGVVLIKIQTVAKVYAIEGDGELRWITSEDVAEEMYGSNWADYVIDVPDTLFPRFEMGSDLDTAEDVDTSGMKTRLEVNS